MQLKEYISINKLEIQKLADSLDIHRTYLWQIVNKKRRPSVELSKKIQQVTLGIVTAAELLGLE